MVRTRGDRGAAVEMALTLPIILALLTGLWEMGRAIEVQQALNNAAGEAARLAATGLYTNAQVQQIARNQLKIILNDTSGALTQNATVVVDDLTTPGADATAAVIFDQIRVTVSVPFADVRWINLTMFTSNTTVLSARVTWRCLRDAEYPTTPPPPPQG
jgi:Flp pilus assembly protein TadG